MKQTMISHAECLLRSIECLGCRTLSLHVLYLLLNYKNNLAKYHYPMDPKYYGISRLNKVYPFQAIINVISMRRNGHNPFFSHPYKKISMTTTYKSYHISEVKACVFRSTYYCAKNVEIN